MVEIAIINLNLLLILSATTGPCHFLSGKFDGSFGVFCVSLISSFVLSQEISKDHLTQRTGEYSVRIHRNVRGSVLSGMEFYSC